MLRCQMSCQYNVQPYRFLLCLPPLYQHGRIGCDSSLAKVTTTRFPSMDFTVLLVGSVALRRDQAVQKNVVCVHLTTSSFRTVRYYTLSSSIFIKYYNICSYDKIYIILCISCPEPTIKNIEEILSSSLSVHTCGGHRHSSD